MTPFIMTFIMTKWHIKCHNKNRDVRVVRHGAHLMDSRVYITPVK